MRGIKYLHSYAKLHFLIDKLFIYKDDMSFKTLNISMAKVLKHDVISYNTGCQSHPPIHASSECC